jgi:predicted DNA binding protein
MAQSELSTTDGSHASTLPLRAQLAIEPHTDSDCALLDTDGSSHEVTQQLKDPRTFESRFHTNASAESRECHSEVVVAEGDELAAEYLTSEVKTQCICPVFAESDCISQITAVRDNRLVVSVTLPNRVALRELMANLDAVDASVTIDWLVRAGSLQATTEINTDSITDKQQTALEKAIEMGYYEQPRTTDLGAIAAELGVSDSAVSQRLNNAETKLVKAYLDDMSD